MSGSASRKSASVSSAWSSPGTEAKRGGRAGAATGATAAAAGCGWRTGLAGSGRGAVFLLSEGAVVSTVALKKDSNKSLGGISDCESGGGGCVKNKFCAVVPSLFEMVYGMDTLNSKKRHVHKNVKW